MVRVLHVLGDLGFGGAEAVVMNWYRHIDRNIVQFDFLVRSTQTNYEEEIISMGGRVYHTASFPKHWLKNYYETAAILKLREWDAIHVHANALLYLKPLQLAKKYEIPIRVIHSHNTKSKFLLLHYINTWRINRWITHKFACSDLAANWMFGSDVDCRIIPNGIELERYAFSQSNRQEIREKLSIVNKTVIGHVGRFMNQKNHPFLIELFERYHNLHDEAILMLVGEGEQMQQIRNLVKQKGLDDAVIFCGATTETYKYYSAMDTFVFPSFFEGLGVALIEAQANGLPCLISERVPTMAIINSNVEVSKLSDGAARWADAIDGLSRIDVDDLADEMQKYDIRTVSKGLEEFYCCNNA